MPALSFPDTSSFLAPSSVSAPAFSPATSDFGSTCVERQGVARGETVVYGVVGFPFEILGILDAENLICAVFAFLIRER